MIRQPYLIQRMKQPYPSGNSILASAFTFGCGYKNGGLSDDAFKLLSEIWRYDYMGSAEFEFGALPKSFQYIAKNIDNYTTGRIDVTAMYEDWSSRAQGKTRQERKITKNAPVYYVCQKTDEQEVRVWIEKMARLDYLKKEDQFRTKEYIGLDKSITGQDSDIIGWHDIDNHYLFFTNEETFLKFAQLFRLKVYNELKIGISLEQ